MQVLFAIKTIALRDYADIIRWRPPTTLLAVIADRLNTACAAIYGDHTCFDDERRASCWSV
jgi:hypothetical protein